jgi:hypothetical protein
MVVERNELGSTTRDAAMQNRVRIPPRYPICSEITHMIAAVIAADIVEPLSTATAETITRPSIAVGKSTWTL